MKPKLLPKQFLTVTVVLPVAAPPVHMQPAVGAAGHAKAPAGARLAGQSQPLPMLTWLLVAALQFVAASAPAHEKPSV